MDVLKTLSKLNLKQAVRGHLGRRAARGGARILKWAKGGEGQTEGVEAKSNWMESI